MTEDFPFSAIGEFVGNIVPEASQRYEELPLDLNGPAVQDFFIEPLSHYFEAQPEFIDLSLKTDAEIQLVARSCSARSSTPSVENFPNAPALDQIQNNGLSTDNERWKALSIRSRAADRQFLYGVQSTKVYCRPSCPSRRPARKNAKFFPYPGAIEAAEGDNFRACKRCKPKTLGTANAGVLGVGFALQKIADEVHRPEQTPTEQKEKLNLEALAQAAGLSMFHFHRLFKTVTLMTPVCYTNACHLLALQDALGMDTGDRGSKIPVSLGQQEFSRWTPRTARKALGGITPVEYSQGAERANIEYTFVDSALGIICIAWSKNKITKCRCPIRCEANALLHALLLGADSENRVRKRFPAAVASNTYSRWLLQCVQELRDEGNDRETELPLSCLPSLRRAKVWSRIMQDPVLGECGKGICSHA